MKKYDHKKIEQKWQDYWGKNPELYFAENDSKKEKKYILDMFPYPSGDGLHVGHVESYTATDILSRYSRMKGLNVLHPQGWDAFGLPAENYAIKTKIHPLETTRKAIATFKGQMNRMGFSYDWSREICSADPEYYKWTQWFFLLLYKNGLAYKKKAKVNWCESCQTVLANEQAESGICERCKNQVIQKDMEQWFFKITDFVEDKGKTSGLINGLDKVDWPESTKLAQKNWINKSEGAQFKMQIIDTDKYLEVFTTRLDTVFGMTFALIAPEHKVISDLKSQILNWKEVKKYVAEAKKKSELQRISETKEKTGIELKGMKVINPFTKEEIPLFVSDFVLAHYGTGAVMAVPAHDERDYEFAKKFNLKIEEVIKSREGESSIEKRAYTEDGILVNSGEYNDLTSEEARKKLTQWLEKEGIGHGTVNYKLRDWLVSRQRYWGAPIPIIYCDKCGEVPALEKNLPVLLSDDVDFMPTGESPLVKSKKFHDVKCPNCGEKARRESDTMDTFVCSSWYYLRYSDPKNDKEFASLEMLKQWLPVDLYVGGAEHSVLHLLYARFFTKVLHNLGYVNFDEPFLKLRHQGIILAEDSRKMSKSFGNVINPDKVVDEYGADALRMFEMFMGPLEAMKPWNTKGIIGIVRFLEKVWNLQSKISDQNIADNNVQILLNKTIKKVTEDIENFRFNTAISQMMILVNAMEKEKVLMASEYKLFLTVLSPFAPHITEELWSQLGNKESIFKEKWPEADEKYLKEEEIEMVVQVNGKLRDKIFVAPDVTEDEAKETALEREKIKSFIEGKEIKKIIFVAGRLINIVIS
ncbi:MAG TPA: leucine--tRNA ligase [Candidatus Moranbacteria bacterium]|nr:leucine--tRNA ligase [Candidatus Moranbacteria bacterium]HRZ33948.1 leucine--tRNA ligase [Candidatus Moranbacteria bacterium]